jgi:transposase
MLTLSWQARQVLQEIARSGSQGRQVRRAQALVWLDEGESVAEVARRLGLSRRAIYKIVERYGSRLGEPICQRVSDGPRSGRPSTQRDQTKELIEALLAQAPQAYGFRSLVWTTSMLEHEVAKRVGRPVSTRTVRRALHDLNYAYKRPRYTLARRSPTWQQAKGGSNAV